MAPPEEGRRRGREALALAFVAGLHDQISAITRFGDNSLFPLFGLPRTLRE